MRRRIRLAPASRHVLLLSTVALLAGPVGTTGCSSCSGDGPGSPGVIVDYSEVASTAAGPVRAEACFAQVCETGSSADPLGARVIVTLDNKAYPPATASLKITDSHGTVLLNTKDDFSIPKLSVNGGCGNEDFWQLNLEVKGGRLQQTSRRIELTPPPPPPTRS